LAPKNCIIFRIARDELTRKRIDFIVGHVKIDILHSQELTYFCTPGEKNARTSRYLSVVKQIVAVLAACPHLGALHEQVIDGFCQVRVELEEFLALLANPNNALPA
jgi:hypothetical protein